jgi:hypothetical protein
MSNDCVLPKRASGRNTYFYFKTETNDWFLPNSVSWRNTYFYFKAETNDCDLPNLISGRNNYFHYFLRSRRIVKRPHFSVVVDVSSRPCMLPDGQVI